MIDAGPPATTRQRLLDETLVLLLERGYHATTVQAVARRADLTVGAIYANFDNKHQLIAEALLTSWATSGSTILAMMQAGDLPMETFLPMLATELASPPTPHHRLLTEMAGIVMREAQEGSPIIETAFELDQRLRANIDAAKASGDLAADVPTDALAAILVNLTLGSITSKSYGLTQPSVEDSLALIQRILSVLGPDAPARP